MFEYSRKRAKERDAKRRKHGFQQAIIPVLKELLGSSVGIDRDGGNNFLVMLKNDSWPAV